MKRIIVDMFGADGGPEIVVRGAARALMLQKEYDLVLSGSSLIAQIVLQEEAQRTNTDPAELMQRVSLIETNSFVTNREDPKKMVKERNDTSMVLAMSAMKTDDEIRAMVTAGSTGCALVASCFHLGLQKGLLRPALASMLPKAGGGYTALLDCGANLTPSPKEMEQYAALGAEFVKKSYGVSRPVVGLINVGTEKNKGTAELKEVYERIEAAAESCGYEFAGNIEGGEILSGKLDVAVCDGFTGNVILKGFESVGLLCAQFAQNYEKKKGLLRSEENSGFDAALRQIRDPYNDVPEDPEAFGSVNIRSFFDYNSQAGAIFLGSKKLILKAHGAATEDTICSCILQTMNLDRGRR